MIFGHVTDRDLIWYARLQRTSLDEEQIREMLRRTGDFKRYSAIDAAVNQDERVMRRYERFIKEKGDRIENRSLLEQFFCLE